MYFNFCFCFSAWYSYRNYELCNKIKNFHKIKRLGIKIFNNSEKEKKHDKIVLLAKSKLNGIEVLISKAY